MTYQPQNDPSTASVDEVTAYLAKAEPAEVERVKALEAAPDGKNRKGIVEWAPSASTAKPDEDGYTRRLVEDAYRPGEPVGDTQE